MTKEKKLNLLGQLLLLSATLIWGSSFIILKNTIDVLPVFFVLAIRFLLSGIILGLIFIKKMIHLDKRTFFNGLILGLILSTAYIVQTFGLKYTTASANSFLTSVYTVMVPFLAIFILKKKLKLYHILAAVVCLTGVGFVAFGTGGDSASNPLLGNSLTLLCAVFYALQIIFIDKFQKDNCDPMSLLIIELLVTGIVTLIGTLVFELPSMGISGYQMDINQILSIAYLTIMGTLLAQFGQMFGQRFTPTTQASIILSLESVFGAAFAVIIGSEKLSTLIIIGFVLVFIGVLISEKIIKIPEKKIKVMEDENEKSS